MSTDDTSRPNREPQRRGKRERQVEVTAYVPLSLKARVKAQAEREGRSESAVLLEALRRYYTAGPPPATGGAPLPQAGRGWGPPPLPRDFEATRVGGVAAGPRRPRRRRRGRSCCCHG